MTGHVFGFGVGIVEIFAGGSAAAGGGTAEIATAGVASPIALPTVAAGSATVVVGVVTTGQSGALIINDLWAMFSSRGGSGETAAAARELEIIPNRGWRPGRAMTEAEAVAEVRAGGDVIAVNRDTARRIAEQAGNGPPLHEAPHGPGQRAHFHPMINGRRAGGHVLY